MKKLSLQTVAAVACALALNACSSGGGSAPSASSTPTPQQNQNQTEADKKAEDAKKAEELAKQKEAEAAKKAEEAKKTEELAKQKEAERKKAEEAKKAEELAKQQEAERKKAEEAKKAEELAKQQEAERKKAEEAKKAEELAKQQEAERKKAEEAKKAEELAKQQEAERKKAEEEAKKNQANNNPAPPAASSSFTDALAKGFIANHPRKDRADYMDPNKVGGIILSINNTGGTLTGQSPKTEAFDELMLNGTKILLLTQPKDKLNGIGMRTLNERDFEPGKFKGEGLVGSTGIDPRQEHFQNVRYGVYSVDGQSHLFVQGKPTLSMYLSSGRYSYDGHAVYGKDGQYRRAKTDAVVDFGNKTIEVTITPQGISGQVAPNPLKFGGVIKGNTFSGTQNNIETKGGFFGPGGTDLGGVYHATGGEHAGYNGAYGASNRVRTK